MKPSRPADEKRFVNTVKNDRRVNETVADNTVAHVPLMGRGNSSQNENPRSRARECRTLGSAGTLGKQCPGPPGHRPCPSTEGAVFCVATDRDGLAGKVSRAISNTF